MKQVKNKTNSKLEKNEIQKIFWDKSINMLIEDMKNRITWLIWLENFEYENLINFKRKVLEKYDFKKWYEFNKFLTEYQKQLLEKYKEELYESSIYGSPLEETEDERIKLKIGEELYFIEKNIEKILKKL